MAHYGKALDLPVDIPKRPIPWFTRMLFAFAVLVLVAVVYSFWNMARAPLPKLELPAAQDQPAVPAPPEATPRPPTSVR